MAKHAVRFLKMVEDAKSRIREVTVAEVCKKGERGDTFLLVDVREDSEWAGGHLPDAIHLGKGIIERDIEQAAPDLQSELVLY